MEPHRLRRTAIDVFLGGAVLTVVVVAVVAGTSASNGLTPAAPVGQPTAGGEADDLQARDEWFYGQRAYPNDSLPAGAYLRAQGQARQARAATATRLRSSSTSVDVTATDTLSFTELGPRPISTFSPDMNAYPWFGSPPVAGRVAAIATHPSNSQVVYIGSASGGVWRTTNDGGSWEPLFDQQPSLSIGSITFDPNDESTIYVGTGENNQGGAYMGAGIFRGTIDAGGNVAWAKLGPAGQFDECHIWKIVVEPGDSQTLLAAVQGRAWTHSNPWRITSCDTKAGIWRSTDRGANWQRVITGSPSDLAISPDAPNTVYAGYIGFGVWKSEDSGASGSWSRLTGGLPTTDLGRTSIAVSPTNADVVYAAFELASTQAILGVWSTTTGGTAWTSRPVPTDFCGSSQCDYDMVLAVDPADTTRFSAGGVYLLDYTNGGANWALRGYGRSGIHVDFHAMAYDADGRLWLGSDGGVYRTPDRGATLTNLTNGLGLTQFYPGISGSTTTRLVGGAQDNGTSEYTGGLGWRGLIGADGGYSAVNPSNTNVIYGTWQYLMVERSGDGGDSFEQRVSGLTEAGNNDTAPFIAPLVMDPQTPETLYAGSSRLYKTTDQALNWNPISPDFGAFISTIARAPDNAQVIYVGTENGQVRVTQNGGTTAAASWPNTAEAPLPAAWITDIAVHPTNEGLAYVTVSGFTGKHVFKTANFGADWEEASGSGAGALPNAPANGIAIDADATPETVYVATDVGVFWSSDGGATWNETSSNLPNAIVMDVLVDKPGAKLVASTYGRGMWAAPLLNRPTVSKIVYRSTRNAAATNEDDIFVVNADGTGNVTDLTNNTSDDEDPASSPDGSQIAFASIRDGDWDIYVMNADGTNVRQITNTAGVDEFPTWSPDGQWLAFDSNRSGNYDIYVVPTAGGTPTPLTTDAANDHKPSWAPGGGLIAFESIRTGNWDVFTVAPTGGTQTNLTNQAGNDRDPAWSPDGTKLALTRDNDIYVINADGTNLQARVTHADVDGFPSWSPAADVLLFDTNRDGNYNLFKVPAGGGTAARFSSNAADDRDGMWLLQGVTDAFPPETTINSGPSGATAATTASFTFSANELGATFECKLDGASFGPCTSPKEYTLLGAGSHTFSVRGKDSATNVDATPAARTWTVAAVPAAPTGVSATPLDAAAEVTWSAPSDGGSPITGYTVTPYVGGVAQAPTVLGNVLTTTVTGLTNGTTYTFKVKATNAVGTGPESAASNDVTPSGAAPQTTVNGPTGTYVRSAATYTLGSSPPGSQFECRTNGGAWSPCVSPHTVSGLSLGRWALEFRAFTGTAGAAPAVTPDPTPETRELRVVRPFVVDWDGNGKANVNVWRPSSGGWLVQGSPNAFFGRNGDVPVPGQWDADAPADRAVWRPTSGGWYVEGSPTSYFGAANDVPVPGQWDADAELDKAVWRPVSGGWYVQGSPTSFFGRGGDVPVPGDYDADAALDRAVFRPSNGAWFVEGSPTVFHGQNGDVPIPADWNGDGKTDIAVFRPSNATWYLRGISTTAFGAAGDVPLAGDFDADAAMDKVLFRPTTGAWYADTGTALTFFGVAADVP